jgi:hypothetical protein
MKKWVSGLLESVKKSYEKMGFGAIRISEEELWKAGIKLRLPSTTPPDSSIVALLLAYKQREVV